MRSFISACFSGRVNLKQIQEKMAVGGTKLFWKIFKIFHGVMVFLVLFEQILIKLFAPHLESFTECDAFCSHIFDLYMCAYIRPRVGPEKFGGWDAILN